MSMKALTLIGLAAAVVAAQPVLAAGDPVAGKKNFNRCKTCHTVKKGKNRVGPSLYCVVGRKAGTAAQFVYSKDMKKAAATDFAWTEERIFEYLAGPKVYIGKIIGKKKANLKMFNNFPKPDFRRDVIAFLKSVCKE